jgi:hypothetical protein
MVFSTMMTFSIPLTMSDRQQAETFKAMHPIAQQANQVYENTLAVLATHHYLEMLGIPTELENSYCWNPIAFLSTNIADLYLPETRGRLECRSVRFGEEHCFIPEEVWGDRVGYVVVRLNETNTEAVVLGFVPEVETEQVLLSELRSLDDLIDAATSSYLAVSNDDLIPLIDILNRCYKQKPSDRREGESSKPFLAASGRRGGAEDAYALRSADWRTILEIGQPPVESVELTVFISKVPEEDELFNISFRFKSCSESQPLPKNLEILISDIKTGEIYHQVQAEDKNIFLELPLLNCQLEESYRVKMTLGDNSVIKEFKVYSADSV